MGIIVVVLTIFFRISSWLASASRSFLSPRSASNTIFQANSTLFLIRSAHIWRLFLAIFIVRMAMDLR